MVEYSLAKAGVEGSSPFFRLQNCVLWSFGYLNMIGSLLHLGHYHTFRTLRLISSSYSSSFSSCSTTCSSGSLDGFKACALCSVGCEVMVPLLSEELVPSSSFVETQSRYGSISYPAITRREMRAISRRCIANQGRYIHTGNSSAPHPSVDAGLSSNTSLSSSTQGIERLNPPWFYGVIH